MMKQITSVQNEYIKMLKSLKTKKGRGEHGLYIAEGHKIVGEALMYADVHSIVCTSPIEQYEDKLILVPQHILNAIADTKTPQEVIAVLRIPPNEFNIERGIIVILEDISDPQNLGAIIRTADAVGAAGIIVSKDCADHFAPKCVRACMGSNFHLPIYESSDLAQDVCALKARGFNIVATHLDGQSKLTRTPNTAVIIGNEARGISKQLAALADELYKIPIYGKAESLNAAVAAGITLYKLVDIS